MLHIALCDDQPQQLQAMQALLERYLAERALAGRVRTFSGGQALLDAVDAEESFDLYILDIVMPGLDGIQLGRALRQREQRGPVIYLSTSADFALESYAVRAFYYLLKPVTDQTLFPVLDEAAATLQRHEERSIALRTREGTLRLRLDDILYAELVGRQICYHLRGGECVDSLTLNTSFRSATLPLTRDGRFLACGASFVANLCYIRMVDKTGAVFDSGLRLELPKTACAALRKAWSNFWLEGGEAL